MPWLSLLTWVNQKMLFLVNNCSKWSIHPIHFVFPPPFRLLWTNIRPAAIIVASVSVTGQINLVDFTIVDHIISCWATSLFKQSHNNWVKCICFLIYEMSSASCIAQVHKRCPSISGDWKVFTIKILIWVIIYSSLNKVLILSLLKIGHFLFREMHMSLKLFSSQVAGI